MSDLDKLGAGEATRLIDAMGKGDPRAAQELLPLVYHELRRLARSHMAHEQAGHTLEATALVHEAYLRLVGDSNARGWDGKGHFFAAAAEAMRRILIEHARRKQSLKRGGAVDRVQIDDDIAAIRSPCDDVDDLLALNDALDRLERVDPSKAELIKLLYFAGMTLDQTAAALGISRTSAHRQCVFARAWLHDAMERPHG